MFLLCSREHVKLPPLVGGKGAGRNLDLNSRNRHGGTAAATRRDPNKTKDSGRNPEGINRGPGGGGEHKCFPVREYVFFLTIHPISGKHIPRGLRLGGEVTILPEGRMESVVIISGFPDQTIT